MAYELKTKESKLSVEKFIKAIANEQMRDDCRAIIKLMQKVTNEEPKMWGSSIVGFGSYHYKYDSGHKGDMCITGFSPRKQNLTLYILSGFERREDLMKKLGKYETGKSCLYVKKLADIDLKVLEKLISESVAYMTSRYKNSLSSSSKSNKTQTT
jgi:Domain of unknown function (DU1801)